MLKLLRKKQYIAARSNEYEDGVTDSFLQDGNSSSETLLDPERRQRPHLCSIVILFATHLLVAAVAAWLGSRWKVDVNSLCTLYTTQYCKYR
jgi:hypothetical protein